VWLCDPAAKSDPCRATIKTTVVNAQGRQHTETIAPASDPKADCFYVYPTVSLEKTANSDLAIQKPEVEAAIAQASPFSQVCRVFAPMYRQETVTALAGPGATINDNVHAENIAFASLLSAWRDYLAHDNDGRPFVFIGHSQGAAMLIRLIRSQIDPVASMRARMISAIVLGGNVQVPIGKTVGGSFQHVPACTSARQTGCVIAYSAFRTPPPSTALFGRPGQGVSLQSNQSVSAGQQVLCTNPASLRGGSAPLLSYFVGNTLAVAGHAIKTAWVTYPGRYTAQCDSADGATWLEVKPNFFDVRPKVRQALGRDWGLHLVDVNIAMGNLVDDVALEEAGFGS
jgi:hypothetical protein